jgi:hypothetical protein
MGLSDYRRQIAERHDHPWTNKMDTTTLLIIVLIILLLGGGGWYGRGRWY